MTDVECKARCILQSSNSPQNKLATSQQPTARFSIREIIQNLKSRSYGDRDFTETSSRSRPERRKPSLIAGLSRTSIPIVATEAMSVQVLEGTPLAEALQNAVQPKLVEAGWSTGSSDDNTLAEYVVLMLVNGRNKDEIASELSNELLGLGPDDPTAAEFAQWLFDQVDALNAQLNGQAPASAPVVEAEAHAAEENMAAEQDVSGGDAGDQDMDDASGSMSVDHGGTRLKTYMLTSTDRPTGPKSMRNGSGAPRGRDKRMLGQINRNMANGGDAALHRIKGAAGSRINSHSNREAPKGPRGQAINRALQMQSGRPPMGGPMGQMGFNPQQQQMMAGMAQGGPLNPSQQMQLLAMMEQQSQMMAQLMGGGPPGFNPAAQNGMPGQGPNGKSLFDRVEDGRPNRRNNRPNKPFQHSNGNQAHDDTHSTMDVEASADPENTLCRFNLSCTRADCNFAHQSPAAPPGVNIDMSDSCSFGAACKNFKCTAKHPSPAKKFAHQAEIQCSFWPNCTKPNCPFKHPAPLCRNGGDCSVPGCQFTHNTTMCKFNPCKNPKCMFKHAEGQKGVFTDKVWTAEGEGDHVSERRFVDEEGGAEELIIPGGPNGSNDASLAAPAMAEGGAQQPQEVAQEPQAVA